MPTTYGQRRDQQTRLKHWASATLPGFIGDPITSGGCCSERLRPSAFFVTSATTVSARTSKPLPSPSSTERRSLSELSTAVFWLRQIERLAQDLVPQRLVQLADLALQEPISGSRHYLVDGVHRRQRALGAQPCAIQGAASHPSFASLWKHWLNRHSRDLPAILRPGARFRPAWATSPRHRQQAIEARG